jgi:hypothetical protein
MEAVLFDSAQPNGWATQTVWVMRGDDDLLPTGCDW